jgi:hypothetical protein
MPTKLAYRRRARQMVTSTAQATCRRSIYHCILYSLFLHLLISFFAVLHGLFRQSLGLFSDGLGYLLMSALCRSIQRAHPGHLKLKLLVLAVFMRKINYLCSSLYALLKSETPSCKVQLFKFRLCGLTTLAGCRTVVALFAMLAFTKHRIEAGCSFVIPSMIRWVQSCIETVLHVWSLFVFHQLRWMDQSQPVRQLRILHRCPIHQLWL